MFRNSSSSEDDFVSWSGVVQGLEPLHGSVETVVGQLFEPREAVIINDTRPALDSGEKFPALKSVSIRLWMGSGGSRVLGHYDWSHNCHVSWLLCAITVPQMR